MVVHFLWVLFLNAWYVAGSKEQDARPGHHPRWWIIRLIKALCCYLPVQFCALTKEGCISMLQVACCRPKTRNRMKQEANDAPGNATTTDEQNVTERQDPQRDIEEGLPGGQVHDLGDDHRHSTRRQEENNARRKNKNLAEDMYRRLTPTLFVTSSAADADLALDWVFAVELLRRSRTDIDYKFFVLSAIFSSIGSLLWVLCTFDISGFSGPRPPNVPESEWTRPEHHPFWWMLPKGFLVFVTVLLEDIPQLVITSVVQRKYDPSNLTSFALANIVTSLYAMGLKLVQTFMEQSTYELDIPTTINLANAFEENNEFGLLLEARQSAEKLIEKSMYAFAYGRVTVRTDDPAWETLLLAFSSDAVSHFRVLGHLSAQKGKNGCMNLGALSLLI
mmetsp:Transcript_14077/g.28379  ORF Transcript_14077/g.28379 Transcript_14077/m.28379 type:complete len:391 (+) Transcript_14077:136-1308(+)